MITENWNPVRPGMTATLLNLNRCFGGAWNETLYRWYLERPFEGRNPDRLVMDDGSRALAGSVINYRQLLAPDGTIRDIGIATASWTLPDARGQGLFTRMMRASVARAGDQGCRYFLAFVTEENASRGALERCGAVMIPAVYAVGSPQPGDIAADAPIESAEASGDVLYQPAPARGVVRFHYGSAGSWAAQHLERPLPVEVCRLHGELAIIEKTSGTDRLQWTSAAPGRRRQVAASLAGRAAAAGRRFFMYATGSSESDVDATAGIDIRRGYVACLPTASGEPDPLNDLGTDWDVQSGDRM